MNVLLGLPIYFAIGGLMNGMLEFLDLDAFAWLFAWPITLFIILVYIIAIPFEKLGRFIVEKLADIF